MVTNDNQTLVYSNCDGTSAVTTEECLNLGLTTGVCTVTAVLHQEKQIEWLHPKPFLLIKCAKQFVSSKQTKVSDTVGSLPVSTYVTSYLWVNNQEGQGNFCPRGYYLLLLDALPC